ncbi:TIGR02588 family protein [Phormidium sp. CCY1219]|uniref:TIGR02588 family protein n=1 Tax=Phormidium sp. CCY1219 TaxID=2886104 RepID=UPI002D1F30C7|nr:TIGR02588 family protein [Phormidium sp. CCY1219]MEB3830720.1 TIGR02588 family protein [Phormidium sp. CCY1219]
MSRGEINNRTQRKEIAGRSPAEWVTFAIGLVILGISIVLVGYDWTNHRENPPVISVKQSGEVRAYNGQFYVPFTVKNEGGETAAAVRAIAELKIDGEIEEKGELEIDFLSQDETESGAFIFTQNPDDGQLVLRISSYKLP